MLTNCYNLYMQSTIPTVSHRSPLTNDQKDLVSANTGLVMRCLAQLKVRPQFREDAKQAGLMALCVAAQTYDADLAKFSTYATICIQRSMWTAIEKEHRLQPASEFNSDEESSFDTIESDKETSVEANEFWQKLEHLPKEQSAVIRLRLKDDMDWRAIGAKNGYSSTTAMNLYNRGIEQLRKMK